MFELGVIDYQGLVKGYMDLGYKKEDAEKLARFTILETMENQRTMITDQVIAQFREGLITEDELKSRLADLGFPPQQAEAVVSTELFLKMKKQVERITNAVRSSFMKGQIDRSRAFEILSAINLKADAINELLDQWEVEDWANVSMPSHTELIRFLRKGIIDQETFREYMRRLGYSDDVITWFIIDAGITPASYTKVETP
jgi:hypothetical protein